MKEIWKDICGFEGKYQVSNVGRIRGLGFKYKVKFPNKLAHRISLPKLYVPVLVGHKDKSKRYFAVSLEKNNKYKQYRIHALVLEMFIGPRPKGMHGAHLNGNRLDNRLSNLKWCTAKENMSHKILHGTQPMGENTHNHKLTPRMVIEIREKFRPRIESNSRLLAEKFKCSQAAIADVIAGRCWSHIK